MPTWLRRVGGSLGRQLSWLTNNDAREGSRRLGVDLAELKAQPERREAVRAQLEASVEPKYDSRVQFNPKNAKKKTDHQGAAEVFERAVSCALRIRGRGPQGSLREGSNGAQQDSDASARSARSCMLSGSPGCSRGWTCFPSHTRRSSMTSNSSKIGRTRGAILSSRRSQRSAHRTSIGTSVLSSRGNL